MRKFQVIVDSLSEGLCQPRFGHDPELWSTDEELARSIAVHICQQHCPVIVACSTIGPIPGHIVAGVSYTQSGIKEAPRNQPKPTSSCGRCQPVDAEFIRALAARKLPVPA